MRNYLDEKGLRIPLPFHCRRGDGRKGITMNDLFIKFHEFFYKDKTIQKQNIIPLVYLAFLLAIIFQILFVKDFAIYLCITSIFFAIFHFNFGKKEGIKKKRIVKEMSFNLDKRNIAIILFYDSIYC